MRLAAPMRLPHPQRIYFASISDIQFGLKGLRVEWSRSNKSKESPLGFFKYQAILSLYSLWTVQFTEILKLVAQLISYVGTHNNKCSLGWKTNTTGYRQIYKLSNLHFSMRHRAFTTSKDGRTIVVMCISVMILTGFQKISRKPFYHFKVFCYKIWNL